MSFVCSGVHLSGSTVNGSLSIDTARHVLPLLRRQDSVGHRGQPNVDIETDLMTRMAGDHWSAARLRHVADKKPRPAIKGACVARKPLEKIEQPRIAPVAVAGEPHHLPVRAVDGKRHAASEASFGIRAYRASCERRRRRRGAKQFFSRRALGLRRLLGLGHGFGRHKLDRRLGDFGLLSHRGPSQRQRQNESPRSVSHRASSRSRGLPSLGPI